MIDANLPRPPIDTGHPVDDQGRHIYLLTGPDSTSEKHKGIKDGKHRGRQNLILWKPGQSGNPKGRPKRKTITEAIYERLMAQAKDGTPLIDIFAKVGIDCALAGDHRFWIEIARKIDGEKAQGILTAIFNTQNNVNMKADVSGMNIEDLRKLRELLAGMAGRSGRGA